MRNKRGRGNPPLRGTSIKNREEGRIREESGSFKRVGSRFDRPKVSGWSYAFHSIACHLHRYTSLLPGRFFPTCVLEFACVHDFSIQIFVVCFVGYLEPSHKAISRHRAMLIGAISSRASRTMAAL